MAIRHALPFTLPVINGIAPTGKVTEVGTAARHNQHSGFGAEGKAPEQRAALKVDAEAFFNEIAEDCVQHASEERGIGELFRRHVP